ncbi:MAG: TIGR03663 family protein [Verrucomicrobia bacterium]|nr:TIGR03663 family protein [Verrucomicrobiota bacterium]
MVETAQRRPDLRRVLAVGALCAIALAALATRSSQLDRRPMHHDEANQAVRAGALLETGTYTYDPSDHHGPSLYYLSLPIAWLTSGRDFAHTTEVTYRLLPVLCSVGLILLFGLLRDGLGWPATIAAGLFAVVSPIMFYYSRFFIQETLFVFSIVGTIGFVWRWLVSRHRVWSLFAGACLGLMHATKETCVIAIACMAVGGFVVRPRVKGADQPMRPAQMLMMIAVAVGVSVTFYSSFFTNWRGVPLSLTPYLAYVRKAYAPPLHEYGPFYYLRLLLWTREGGGPVWSEAMLLALAVTGGISGFLRGRLQPRGSARLIQFIAVYTLVSTAVYSCISYKTPWNILPFMIGVILLAGVGAVWIWDRCPRQWLKGLIVVLLIGGTTHLGRQCYLGNFRYHSDPRNPYAYVQTSTDFLRLVQRIHQVSALDEAGHGLMICVATGPYEAWPLPWYLRDYKHTGYWADVSELPLSAKPALIIASSEKFEDLQATLEPDYMSEYYGLRQNVMMILNIRKDLWNAFLDTRRVVAE